MIPSKCAKFGIDTNPFSSEIEYLLTPHIALEEEKPITPARSLYRRFVNELHISRLKKMQLMQEE